MDKHKEIRLVSKLHKLTLDGQVDWRVSRSSAPLKEEEEIVSTVLESVVGGVGFKIYNIRREKIRKDIDQFGMSYRPRNNIFEGNQTYIDDSAVLEVFDVNNRVVMDSIIDNKKSAGVRRLLQAARKTISDVDDKIDAFLMIEEVKDAKRSE